jgi:septal ring factor EnvC (AmiA/AmiB activator)
MSLGKKALVVAIVSLLGLWGCAKGPSNGSAAAERIKFLEGKISKLESDFRAVASARDQIKSQLATLEEQHNQLQQEVAKIQKERGILRAQVVARTGERDALQVQYDQFRKAIKDAIGQAEAAALPLNPQPVTASGTGTPGKL